MAGKISDGLQLFGGQIGPQMQGDLGNLARSLMPNPEGSYRANMLPAMRMPDGSVEMAVPGVVRDGITGLAEWFDAGKAAGEGKPWSVSGEAITALPASSAVLGSVAGGVPKGALRTFGGINAKTADKAALKQAQDMAAAGADRRAIWDATGWFEGPDKKWRFEIDDSGMVANQNTAPNYDQFPLDRFQDGNTVDIADVWSHPELSKNYDVMDEDYYLMNRGDAGGKYDPEEGIGLSEKLYFGGKDFEGPKGAKGVTAHELQHAIQNREGFAVGGSPSSAYLQSDMRPYWNTEIHKLLKPRTEKEFTKLLKASWPEATPQELKKAYRAYAKDARKAQRDPYHPAAKAAQETAAGRVYQRIAGEAEARNVQTRLNMTPEQRRATPPWETLDVPEDELIVRFGDEAAQSVDGGLLSLTDAAAAKLTPAERLDIAQRNAALPVEKGGLGLPPDNTPEMRAKAMGGIDAFHGTSSAIDRFDPYMSRAEGPASFLSINNYGNPAATANTYARGIGANVMPLKVFPNNFSIKGVPTPRGDDVPKEVITRWMNDVDRFNARLDVGENKNILFRNEIERAKSSGKDGVVIENVKDDRTDTPWANEADVFAVINPARIRSRFAAFDPARKDSADLLAANPASGGLLAAPQIMERLRQIEEDEKKGPLARSLLAPGVI